MKKNGKFAISLDGSIIFKIYPELLNSYNLTICLNPLSPQNLRLVPLVEKPKKKKKLELKPLLNKTKNNNNNNKNLLLLLNKKELLMLNKLN